MLFVQSMGWVETGSCRRYSQSAGASALASLPQDTPNRGAFPVQCSQGIAANFLCAQALKVAMQLSCYAGNQQVSRQSVQRHIGRHLEILAKCQVSRASAGIASDACLQNADQSSA